MIAAPKCLVRCNFWFRLTNNTKLFPHFVWSNRISIHDILLLPLRRIENEEETFKMKLKHLLSARVMEISENKLEMKMKHLSKHQNYDAMKRRNENKQGLRAEQNFEISLF